MGVYAYKNPSVMGVAILDREKRKEKAWDKRKNNVAFAYLFIAWDLCFICFTKWFIVPYYGTWIEVIYIYIYIEKKI
jgi:hypothetical protein